MHVSTTRSSVTARIVSPLCLIILSSQTASSTDVYWLSLYLAVTHVTTYSHRYLGGTWDHRLGASMQWSFSSSYFVCDRWYRCRQWFQQLSAALLHNIRWSRSMLVVAIHQTTQVAPCEYARVFVVDIVHSSTPPLSRPPTHYTHRPVAWCYFALSSVVTLLHGGCSMSLSQFMGGHIQRNQ